MYKVEQIYKLLLKVWVLSRNLKSSLSIYLFIYLSIDRPTCLSLSVCVCVCVCVCLSVCLSSIDQIHISLRKYVYEVCICLSLCLFDWFILSVCCPSTCLSVWLSVCLLSTDHIYISLRKIWVLSRTNIYIGTENMSIKSKSKIQSIYLSTDRPTYRPTDRPTDRTSYLPIYLPTYIYLSIYLSIYRPACLSVLRRSNIYNIKKNMCIKSNKYINCYWKYEY